MPGCDEVARELSALVDGDVSFWRKLQLHAHLAMCDGCSRLHASLRRTVAALHQLRDEPPDHERP